MEIKTGIDLRKISSQIESKREIYVSLIKSTFNFSSQNLEEKTQIANDKFTAEKELYLMRLKDYEIENQNAQLSIFQGVNIFLEVLQTGLSFSEVSNHIYLSVMIGSRGEITWKMTSDAVVYMAQRVGAISHISDVVIVRKDEEFEVFNDNGEFKVKHSLKFTDESIDYKRDFLCGYVYVIYPSGYRELRIVNRQQMDDAYKMTKKPDNYNKISMLKSKIVKRALRFDRKSIIESMVNSPIISVPRQSDFVVNIDDIPEIAKDFDDVEEVKEVTILEQQHEAEPKEEAGDGLFDGLDLDF